MDHWKEKRKKTKKNQYHDQYTINTLQYITHAQLI